jgi:hypothetical protein
MIKGVHTMFYSSQPQELRRFLQEKLGFSATDVGEGWLKKLVFVPSRALW